MNKNILIYIYIYIYTYICTNRKDTQRCANACKYSLKHTPIFTDKYISTNT